jgi:hypothetical protein
MSWSGYHNTLDDEMRYEKDLVCKIINSDMSLRSRELAETRQLHPLPQRLVL